MKAETDPLAKKDASTSSFRILIVEAVVAGLVDEGVGEELRKQAKQLVVSAARVLSAKASPVEAWHWSPERGFGIQKQASLRNWLLPKNTKNRKIQVQILKRPEIELGEVPASVEQFLVRKNEFWKEFRKLADGADGIVWIEPEPIDLLWKKQLLGWSGKILRSSSPWIDLFQEKARSSSIPSFDLGSGDDRNERTVGAHWCLKPKDSCGCQDVYRLEFPVPVEAPEAIEMAKWFLAKVGKPQEASKEFLLSPWIAGIPMSLSMIWQEGACLFLPPCRQIVADLFVGDFQTRTGQKAKVSKLDFTGVERESFSSWNIGLNEKILKFLSKFCTEESFQLEDLAGWIGVDFVMNADGVSGECDFEIVEVNGRFTTSVERFASFSPG